MTDQELVAAFAEKVLGWVKQDDGWWYDSDDISQGHDDTFDSPERFDPLNCDSDAWAGVDAHPEWVGSLYWNGAGSVVGIHHRETSDCLAAESVGSFNGLPAARRRALVLACLRAVGVEV